MHERERGERREGEGGEEITTMAGVRASFSPGCGGGRGDYNIRWKTRRRPRSTVLLEALMAGQRVQRPGTDFTRVKHFLIKPVLPRKTLCQRSRHFKDRPSPPFCRGLIHSAAPSAINIPLRGDSPRIVKSRRKSLPPPKFAGGHFAFQEAKFLLEGGEEKF